MRIHFYGFQVSFRQVVTTPEFFAFLAKQTTEIRFRGLSRILRIETTGEISNGMVLTVRDQKKFFELTRTLGQYTINQRTVGEGGLLDFNFFSFNHKTGVGIYQQYHHSLGLTSFGRFLGTEYQKFRRALLEVNPKAKPKPAAGLTFTPVVRRQDFPTLLRTLSEIKKLKFSVATVDDSGSVFSPLSTVTKYATHEVTFSENPISKITAAIKNFMALGETAGVAVSGKDADGIDQIVRLQGNLASYHETDFDSLVGDVDIDVDTFESHPVSREIQRLMIDHHV